jgi:predicted restriction endonuclease
MMPKAVAPVVVEDPFATWLGKSTKLAESSVDKYARAVRTVSQEMMDQKIISKPILEMDSFELDIAMALIAGNAYFIDKNKRGNHMYSNALKQFRYYRNAEGTNETSGDLYVSEIANDISIPETERTAIVQSRVGQGQFRKQLIDKYNGSCVITGINHPKLLVASHIKPWAASNNQERLQVDNGLLLSATYDRLFDSGLITFDRTGKIYLSSFIGPENEMKLHLQSGTQYPLLVTSKMQHFLEYHNDVVFVK